MLIDPFSKRLLNSGKNNKPIALMYHSIFNKNSQLKSPWSISLQQFIQHLDLLQDYGWTTVCSSQLSDPIDQLPKKTVVITFDDGYADNYQAFEELVKRNMLASWFIVSNDLGKSPSWSDADTTPSKLLETTQLIDMLAAGMEIGSHTLSHCRLTEASNEKIHAEVFESRCYLSDLLDSSITSFAYPYGLYNETVLLATKSAGYQVAFTTSSGFGFIHNNPLESRRISIMSNDSLSTFARKITFAANDVSWNTMAGYGLSRVKSHLGF